MRILAVDLAGIFHRRWHASADKEADYSRRWTLEHIRSVAGRGYDSVVIALEGHGPTHRHERYTEYKANRPERDERLIEQLRQTEEACEREGWHCVRRDGMEADDIIASVAQHFEQEHGDVCVDILSDDKDFCQCVSGAVSLLRGERADDLGREYVEHRYGVLPCKFPQFQALCGDKADNIPGVPGIGEKTAAALLMDFGDLRGIVAAAHDGKITGKRGEAIKTADASGELALSLALVTLRTDALTADDLDALLVPKKVQTETEADFMYEDQRTDPEKAEAMNAEAAIAELELEDAPSTNTPSQLGVAMVRHESNGTDWSRSLEPRDMAEAKQLAKYVMDSRLFSSFGTPQAALLVVMAGREMGIGAMSSLRSMHIVEGKPTLSAQLIKGLCQRSPECEYFRMVELTPKLATFETKRRGEPEATRLSYSMDDAEAAGLTSKKNWRSYPKQMMANRCMAELGRYVYPDVVANLYTADELGAEEYVA